MKKPWLSNLQTVMLMLIIASQLTTTYLKDKTIELKNYRISQQDTLIDKLYENVDYYHVTATQCYRDRSKDMEKMAASLNKVEDNYDRLVAGYQKLIDYVKVPHAYGINLVNLYDIPRPKPASIPPKIIHHSLK